MNADRISSRQPSQDPRPGPTTRFYRDRDIEVTSRWFRAGGRQYEIAQLSNLTRARGSIHPGVMVGLVIAVGDAAVAVLVAGVGRSMLAVAIGLLSTLVPCAVAFYCARRWPPRHELGAEYRGSFVELFASRDEREFGQVSRALTRAVEAAHADDLDF
jgi:hypothetical protein